MEMNAERWAVRRGTPNLDGVMEEVSEERTLGECWKTRGVSPVEKIGGVFQVEGTAWHSCDYCCSEEQPQGVPGQYLHFMCMWIYAFSVHMAFISGVMIVVTPSPFQMHRDVTGALCLHGNAVSSPECGYSHAIVSGSGTCSWWKSLCWSMW